MSNMQIAETIRDQIGNKAIVMMGAKNFIGGTNFLGFKVGGNDKKISYINIELRSDDTYTMKFYKGRGVRMQAFKKHSGIYADRLNVIIEYETGMYLSL